MSFLEKLNLKKIRPFFLPGIAIFLIINANIGIQSMRNRPYRELVSNFMEGYGKCLIEAEDYQLTQGKKNIIFECYPVSKKADDEVNSKRIGIYVKLVKTFSGKESKEKTIKYYILQRLE